MKEHADVQIITLGGVPAFAVLPYSEYLALIGQYDDASVHVPNEVVGLCIEKGLSLIAAWRTHLGLSQNDLAARMDITQPAVAQLEKPDSKPQRRTLKKAAKALGICVEQLTE